MFACQKINGVGKLNFYKDGGIKGVSGAILTLKKPSCIRAFSYQCYPLYCTTPCRSFLRSFLNVQFSSSQQLCTRINSFHMAYLHNVLWFIKINKKKNRRIMWKLPSRDLTFTSRSVTRFRNSVGFFFQTKEKEKLIFFVVKWFVFNIEITEIWVFPLYCFRQSCFDKKMTK